MKSFTQKVYEVVAKIPRGSVMTYKEVAKAAGHPNAYRAVGNALNRNPNPYPVSACRAGVSKSVKAGLVPCHRVVKSDGTVGGFASGQAAKITRLKAEGYLS